MNSVMILGRWFVDHLMVFGFVVLGPVKEIERGGVDLLFEKHVSGTRHANHCWNIERRDGWKEGVWNCCLGSLMNESQFLVPLVSYPLKLL